jgi:hypothetical protein
VYFFLLMVVVFSVTGGPPEAIATPANTLSTVCEVASGIKKHGSILQTIIMGAARDVQLRHDRQVYPWMYAVTDEKRNVSIQESAMGLPFDVLIQELAAVCLLTDDIDVPKKDSVTADILAGEVTVSMEESATAGSSTGNVDMPIEYPATADVFNGGAIMLVEETAYSSTGDNVVLTQESVTTGSTTEDIDTHEALATSTENDSIAAEDAGDGNKGAWTWSSLGRRILSQIACATSAHCVMAAAAEDNDPQWEVFERYRCDTKNSWQAELLRDRIDDFLGWRPCELQILK